MRAVARERIFVDDTDRTRFLSQLEEVTERWGWRVVCWCLMGTNFHLVIEAEREQMSLAVTQARLPLRDVLQPPPRAARPPLRESASRPG
jgi:REP element-mobilizing transposase RayT